MRRLREERGSAALEFITAGLLLIVPLVYLILVIGRIQSASLAAEGAARQAVRVFVTAPTSSLAHSQAQVAIADALADAHLPDSAAQSRITCTPSPSACLSPGSWVSTHTTFTVTLPFVPPIFSLDKFARVSVSAEATEQVP